MSKKLYVGNLSYEADEESMREEFSKSGEVQSVKIITDPATGRSRGFGFVEMTSDEDAEKAMTALNGSIFMGRNLVVKEAHPQRERQRSGGRERDFGPARRGKGHRDWR